MSQQVIVLVCESDDPRRGEITIVESEEHAERLTETLLDAGIDAGRIRVFGGSEKNLQVTYRPVVAFKEDGDDNVPELVASEPGVRNGERFSDMFARSA